MLEILILISLGKSIGRIVKARGRKKGRYQLLLVALWFGGEFFGAICGGIVAVLTGESGDSAGLLAYLFALMGAIVGAVVAFQIVKNLKPLQAGKGFPLSQVELDRWSDRFKPSEATAGEGYTASPDRSPPPADDRIQH